VKVSGSNVLRKRKLGEGGVTRTQREKEIGETRTRIRHPDSEKRLRVVSVLLIKTPKEGEDVTLGGKKTF